MFCILSLGVSYGKIMGNWGHLQGSIDHGHCDGEDEVL